MSGVAKSPLQLWIEGLLSVSESTFRPAMELMPTEVIMQSVALLNFVDSKRYLGARLGRLRH